MGGWKQCCVRNKHIEKEVQEILGQCPECLASPPLSYSTQTKADPTACRYKQGAWGCCHGSRRRNLVMEQICEAWWLTESYLLINMSNTADVYWVSMTLRTPDTPHMICKQIPIKQYLKLYFFIAISTADVNTYLLCYFSSYRSHLFPLSHVVPTALALLSCVGVASSLKGFYGATRRRMLPRETTGPPNDMPRLKQPESIVVFALWGVLGQRSIRVL